ncbi:MAG: hypothetical protein Q6354_09150, partial [Candidatus Brocadiales bacterium]|nr:hypothetical protein [Candidatus Brocadiales bacterium]
MNESVSLPHGELPPEVINRIEDAVSRHSVGLVILDLHSNYSTAASGTFVSVRGRPAILTACHVIEKIKNTGNDLGLALAKYTHKFTLNIYSLEFKCAPKGESESSGPDMGLIYINDRTKLDTIKAMKSFFNLDSYADLIRKEISIPETDFWCVFGIPEEMSD